jgi:D-3-phosphoglycerate dehydrogenase
VSHGSAEFRSRPAADLGWITVKVLLLENIHPVAVEVLEARGFEVELRTSSLSEDELVAALPGVHLLGIRSNTHITPRVLDAAGDLVAIGCFCIGTNQVDLVAAAERGIAVFNAPYSNTRSVVELVIAEIIMLARRLAEKTEKMHAGVWDKSAKGSHEIRGRTLGIVGYGNIGTQLSNLAEAMGLRVVFFDTADRLAHGNARRMKTLDDLLAEADVVSIHVDGRPGNAGMFGAEQFAKMKPRSLFINASRGMVVDDVALREHILSGHIAGAALDVFPVEPKAQGDPFESALRGLDNVILTPHVGGSTQEAQEEIGYFVAGKLAGFALEGRTELSVNVPAVQAPQLVAGHRIGFLHVNVPGVLASVNGVLADAGANVTGQYLSTRGEQGYVVTDTLDPLPDDALAKLAEAEYAIWLRTWDA